MRDYLEEYRFDMNLISEGTALEGVQHFTRPTRMNGELKGKVTADDDVPLVIGINGYAEADIEADIVVIDGFIRGNIHARKICTISPTGTVIGKIETPKIRIEPGAIFEGEASTR